VAKNRYGLEATLPLDWNSLLNAIVTAQSVTPQTEGEPAHA